jgi:hypothetical protein
VAATGTLNASNSLFGRNLDLSPVTSHTDCSGTLTGLGYNLFQNATGCTLAGTLTGNLTGVVPRIGPLQNNGGPTLTRALLSNSPAIDGGDPAGCIGESGAPLVRDQRNHFRGQDGDHNKTWICDIGAYEYDFWLP